MPKFTVYVHDWIIDPNGNGYEDTIAPIGIGNEYYTSLEEALKDNGLSKEDIISVEDDKYYGGVRIYHLHAKDGYNYEIREA